MRSSSPARSLLQGSKSGPRSSTAIPACSSATTGSGAIIVLHPAREDTAAIRRGVVRPPVRPLTQRRLDEPLRFAVRAGRVGAGPAMAHAQRATGGPKAPGPIGRAVVGQDPAHADAVGPKPAQRAPQKAASGRLSFVGEQ